MAKATFERIKFGNIKKNENNIFVQAEEIEQIKTLAKSIKKIGLESPLVVYPIQGGKEQEYRILSGHKRHAALIELGAKSSSLIPCLIVDAPKNNTDEREILLQNNLSRKKPEDFAKEIEEANNLWATMDSARRQSLADDFKSEFLVKNKGCSPKYLADNFRPRCDYIRQQTGLDISNRTVTNIINKYLNKNKEGFPVHSKKEKELLFKDVYNKILALSGTIEIYETGANITSKEKALLKPIKNSLNELIEGLDNA